MKDMQETLPVLSETTLSPVAPPRWFQATTLAERVALLQAGRLSRYPLSPEEEEQADRRLAHWKKLPHFAQSPQLFETRVAAAHLDEADLHFLLGQNAEGLARAFTALPDWLQTLTTAFTLQNPSIFHALPAVQIADPQTQAVFLTIRPLVAMAFARLDSGLAELQQQYQWLPCTPETLKTLLFPQLVSPLLGKMTKTLVLELNVARVQGRLQGETPEQRFLYFLEQLAQPAQMLAFLEEYTVLARYLVETLERWVACTLELLQRLCTDWHDLCQMFSPTQDPGSLVDIHTGEGDTHQQGRSVASLTWSSGLRLVYKPRSLAVDQHFQDLLHWLNALGYQPAFASFKLLTRPDYGWCEFVSAYDCASPEEVERFHQRLGGYLALFYALEATDLHAQNLIAAGEHPMFVDLEALFHPRMALPEILTDAGHETIRHSVLRVGLLPQRTWAGNEHEGIDLSPLAAQNNQAMPFPVATWKNAGTDQMHIGSETMTIQFSGHRPMLQGQEVDALLYEQSVIQGFTAVYRLLLTHREEFLHTVLPWFAHDEVRALLRHTQQYVMLHNDSFHPNVLRDSLERERLLDRLWLDVLYKPALGSVVAAECHDLLAGDIPRFTALPGTRDLFTSSGTRIAHFFPQSSLESVQQCVQSLNEQDMARQVWVIQVSFVGLSLSSRKAPQTHLDLQPAHTPLTRERLLHQALTIGNRLNELALRQKDAIGWLGVTLLNGRDWRPLPAGLDLYNGMAGIAFFLAYLGWLTEDEQATSLARLTTHTLRTYIHQHQHYARRDGIGAFDGAGSLIYLFTHLGTLWQEPAFYKEAEAIVAHIPALLVNNPSFDVLNGSAGCIAALHALQAVAPSTTTLNVAIQCGDLLLQQARPQTVGIGWTDQHTTVPLLGMSHGNAGIALNLLRLWGMSGEQRFQEAAVAALAFERSFFSHERLNWPDLRKVSAEQFQANDRASYVYMTAWCHGAPGIGLARLASLPYYNDPFIPEEIANAFQATINEGFGANHSLCHGDLGNLDFLQTALQTYPELYPAEHMAALQASLLESIEGKQPVSGVPTGVEAPGLMLGLAGTGYALLRQAEPTKVPSLLQLAPPPSISL